MSPRTPWLTAVLLGACLSVPNTSQVTAQVIPLTARQIAAGSPHVVVATVEGSQSRWNDRHTLIVTDYALRIEERLRGGAPERITVTVPGGSVGSETHGVSVSTHLAPGARYLLFLRDLDRPALSPFTGGWQGVYRETGAGFPRLVGSTREILTRVETSPEALDTAWMDTAEDPRLPAKAYDAAGVEWNGEEEPERGPRRAAAPFVVEYPALPPIVFEPLPAGSPFSPVDREMLAYWNLYVRDLFRVSRTIDDGWAWGNGVSEMVGFPPSHEMEEQFGVGWFEGSYSAVLYRYRDGRTVEIDVCLNPARRFTLDEDAVDRDPFQTISYRAAVLYLLGRGWGYQGPYDVSDPDLDLTKVARDSIMNLGQLNPFLHAVDTTAARAHFGTRPIRDGLITGYYPKPEPLGMFNESIILSSETVRAGGSFEFLNPIQIENPGTVRLASPTVEVYLVPRRQSMKGAVLLKRIKVQGRLKSGEEKRVHLGRATVPGNARPGTYFLAFVLRDPKDQYQANNRAWANSWVTLEVTR